MPFPFGSWLVGSFGRVGLSVVSTVGVVANRVVFFLSSWMWSGWVARLDIR